ncbi:MAG: glycoside hydrolase family 2 [Lachnospiraceae bacterium]|nr:glycoside hydrolase family 2 [Lachnospiraceae bacterium]
MRELFTKEGRKLYEDKERIPWQEHPRPLLKRDSFLNLCGFWTFSVYEKNTRIDPGADRIRVPFPPESILSGIGRHFAEGADLIYEKRVSLPENFRREILLLHVDGADQHAAVYIDERLVGEHDGGYEHLTLDISDSEDEFDLKIIVRDNLNDRKEPYGKQRIKRGGMWYTPFSGIWQPVWIESTPREYVETLTISTNMEQAVIKTDRLFSGCVLVETPAGRVEFPLSNGVSVIKPDKPRLWSPEDPYLYHFKMILSGGDEISSYFALREISCGTDDGVARLMLNGKPYFFNGLLDQGYFSDGLCTPADPSLYENDIRIAKEMGFNTLRKHVRVDPDVFYSACDRLGMVVFQDMVNNGRYSFLYDTALPNLGFAHFNDRYRYPNVRTRDAFCKRMAETVRQLYSFPCILYWTIFNEGWGQFDSAAVCKKLRALDDSRIIDAASGWFDQGAGDVLSVHVYNHAYNHKTSEKPVVLSECGGFVYSVAEHVFNPEKIYGYGIMSSAEELQKRIEKFYNEEVLPNIKKGLSGVIYTQLSDVEDETNGLVTYDREVVKIDKKGLPVFRSFTAQAL